MAIEMIELITEKATKLNNLRRVIDDIEKRHQEEIGTLKQQKEILQEELLQEFDRVGITQVKVPSGETIAKATRKGIEVVNEIHAFGWAYENRAVSISKTLVKQKLEGIMKEGKELPAGFEYKEIAYISVRNAKVEAQQAEVAPVA